MCLYVRAAAQSYTVVELTIQVHFLEGGDSCGCSEHITFSVTSIADTVFLFLSEPISVRGETVV